MNKKYKRIILKLSGEALADRENSAILDNDKLQSISKVIKKLNDSGVEIGVVIGAGNIFRGRIAEKIGIDRTDADYMGMLGTMINCLALSSALNQIGVQTRVVSAIECNQVSEPYRYKKARAHLEKGRVVLFAGGTGNPYFTTDSCATLRAIEMNCDAILMGKNGIDGVYSADPNKDKNAKLYKTLSYDELIQQQLEVMDLTAIAMLKGHNIEVRIFAMSDPDNFIKVVNGSDIGTTIKEK